MEEILIEKEIKIYKWKIRVGSQISVGNILMLYHEPAEASAAPKRLKSTKCGVVKRLFFKDGDSVKSGEKLIELALCSHTTVIKDMCADCGADLRQEEEGHTSEASVPMIHSVPELKVTQKLAEKLGKADTDRLLGDKKLVLLVDLDQTLIHSTNDNIPNNLKDVYHFQLYPNSPWYHTRLRPGALQFLASIHQFYELHICTFGARNYAHMIAQFLDEDGKLFSHRILSRDECINMTSKKDNLKSLFPCGDAMVCIIDDREDVWNMASNLIQVKPYHFFQHTGDINAPPGMGKNELDGVQGVDFTKIMAEEKLKRIRRERRRDSGSDGEASQSSDSLEEAPAKQMRLSEDTKEESKEKKTEEKEKVSDAEDNLIEVEDPDDYLMYLEVILKKIHSTFYDTYETENLLPDLKTLIPRLRSQVLVGTRIVFSGVVPNAVPLEESKAFQIAVGLGAEVANEISDQTTHLVAACLGTAKVNSVKEFPNVKLVTPEWLWTCAERWEAVDERLYPVSKVPSKMRQPPSHCSPEHRTEDASAPKFMHTIHPLLSFSNDAINDMEQDFKGSFSTDSESDSSSEDVDIENPPMDKNLKKRKRQEEDEIKPNFFTRPEAQPVNLSNIEIPESGSSDDEDGNKSDEEFPSEKFRRGEDLPSDLDVENDDSSKGSDEPIDPVDDGEWNMMGAALEREFLGLEEN